MNRMIDPASYGRLLSADQGCETVAANILILKRPLASKHADALFIRALIFWSLARRLVHPLLLFRHSRVAVLNLEPFLQRSK